MSEASDRGRNFELKVARILRSKLGAKVSRDRRSGAGINKSDISDYYQEIPLSLELKDQETIKVKEWFRQADDASSFNQATTVVFAADEEILAVLRFSDLVNFVREIADQKAEIDDLRAPLPVHLIPSHSIARSGPLLDLAKIKNAADLKKATGAKSCRGGHISDDYGYCMQLDCKYSRGYRPPKAKK